MNNIKLLQIKLKSKKEYLIGIIEDYDSAIAKEIKIEWENIANSRDPITLLSREINSGFHALREKREFFKGQLTIIKQILKTDKNYE
jgi:hypothetical protein